MRLDAPVEVIRQHLLIRELAPEGSGVDASCTYCVFTHRFASATNAAVWFGVHVAKQHSEAEAYTLDWLP